MNESNDDVLLSEPADASASAAPPRRRGGARALLWLILLALLGGGGWWLWEYVQSLRASAAVAREQSDLIDALRQQVGELDTRIAQNHQSQRNLAARLDEATGANRVLRDEMLAVAERAAALEEAIHRLAESRERSATTLRLDEVEFLLRFGQERLDLFGDVAGALRAYGLAEEALAGLDDPAFAGLRQGVGQERESLRALADVPQQRILARLDTLAAGLSRLPARGNEELPAEGGDASTLRSILARLVRVSRVDAGGAALTPSRQAAQRAAIDLELALARLAAERGDEPAFRAALQRAGAQAERAFDPGSAAASELLAQLQALGTEPLRMDLPALGSSLRELRALRGLRSAAPSNAILPRPLPAEPEVEAPVE